MEEISILRAGFARIDITPGTDCTLEGYAFRWEAVPAGNLGVHDPLYASVLILEDGGRPAVLANVQLCEVPTDLARQLRREIAEKVGTVPERVILSAVHTHSGPGLMSAEKAIKRGKMREGEVPPPEVAYGSLLREKLLEAVAAAACMRYPVEVYAAEAPLGMAYNRRVSTADGGVEYCWDAQRSPELRPALAPDPTCTVVALKQPNGPRSYLLWSIGMHPVVGGQVNRLVSADYPGRACALIEEAIPGCRSIFFLGAAGEAHPWIATQDRLEGIEPVARSAASFVSLLAHGTRPVGAHGKLSIAARSVEIGGCELDLAVWRLEDLWLVAAPVELFGDLGADLRRRLEGPVLLATLSNGAEGYWPTSRAFAEGGYEVDIARNHGLEPGVGEKLIDELVELAGTLG